MKSDQFEALRECVCRAADAELLGRFNQVSIAYKADGSVVTEADLAMQQRLQRELGGLFPEYGFLAEEMENDRQRQQLASSPQGLWVLDPLDGSSNFAAGVPYFCVSLALLHRGVVQLGIVYDPVRRECFYCLSGAGVWLNGERLGGTRPHVPMEKSIALIDFKRLPKDLAGRLATSPPYASQRSFGSVALDFCWLAAGRVNIYLHGRHNLWDYAAGLSILQQAGGQACTLEGQQNTPLDMHPRSSAAALDPELFEEWCRWLGLRQ